MTLYDLWEARKVRPPGPRWGLRTLGFLFIALVAIIVSTIENGYTVGSFGSLLVGFIGAGICSYRGVRKMLKDGGIYARLNRRFR